MLPVALALAALAGPSPQLPAPQEPAPQEPVPQEPVPQEAYLRWSAPPSCPDRATVLTELTARVELDPLAVAVEIHELDASMLHAEVWITGPHGGTSRRLESPSCQSIVDAVVLLAEVAAESMPTRDALVAGPGAVSEPSPATAVATPSEPPPTREAVTPPAAMAPKPRPPRRDGEPRTRARVLAAAVVGGNLVPTVDAGARVSIGIARPRVLADVGAAYVGRGRMRPDDGVQLQFDAWAVVARACPIVPLPTARLALSICAVAAAGAMVARASGPGLADSRTRAQPWLRLAAGPELGVVLSPRVRLVAGLELGGHVLRPGFTLGGLGRIWAPSPFSAHGLLGVEVRFP